MKLAELEKLFAKLSADMNTCGDIEYVLIVNLRREVWNYMEAIKNAGQDVVSDTGNPRLRKKHVGKDTCW